MNEAARIAFHAIPRGTRDLRFLARAVGPEPLAKGRAVCDQRTNASPRLTH